MLGRVGAAAEIIKIDAEILNLRVRLKDKDGPEARARLDELVKRRAEMLSDLERKARKKIP